MVAAGGAPKSPEELRAAYTANGQGHVFDRWDKLSAGERAELLESAKKFDTSRCNRIFEKSINTKAADNSSLKPPRQQDICRIQDVLEKDRLRYLSTGYKMIAQGKLGALLMAGGQGTRLGSSAPKGCYDIGLPSHKPLFQLQAERILMVQRRAAEFLYGEGADVVCPMRFYVMTSPMTHDATLAFFREQRFFGLREDQVMFFQQGTMPCFTENGALIMENESRLAEAPDGNGGLYRGLAQAGCLEDMRKHGVEAVDCFSVDNALVRVGDPVFAGYCREKRAECGARVVGKAYPEEKVGVFASRNGAMEVVEYSDIDPAVATSRDEGGDLRFNWGNVAMHYFTRAFLERAEAALERAAVYHVAKKKIPSKDGPVQGIKLEMFIFDTFPIAKKGRIALFEVVREDEFAPVKNAPGSATDSPNTARDLVLGLHASWVQFAGGNVEDGAEVEVSPLASYGGEDLERYVSGATFSPGRAVEIRGPAPGPAGGGGGGGGGGPGASSGGGGSSGSKGYAGGSGRFGSGGPLAALPFNLAKALLVALVAGVGGSALAEQRRMDKARAREANKFRVLVQYQGERALKKLRRAVPGALCIREPGGGEGCDVIQVGTYSYSSSAKSVQSRLQREGFPAYSASCVIGRDYCE